MFQIASFVYTIAIYSFLEYSSYYTKLFVFMCEIVATQSPQQKSSIPDNMKITDACLLIKLKRFCCDFAAIFSVQTYHFLTSREIQIKKHDF